MQLRCRPRTVAASGPLSIARCSCGRVHLEVHGVTLDLEPADVVRLRDLLGVAVTSLGGARGEQVH